MTAPSEDQFFPRVHQFRNGSQMEELCPKCDHIARVSSFYAPDVGRNWLHCTNKECRHRWV